MSRTHLLLGYKEEMRLRNWGAIAAFTLIIALTVAEGIDEGVSLWGGFIIAIGVLFILQAAFRLRRVPG